MTDLVPVPTSYTVDPFMFTEDGGVWQVRVELRSEGRWAVTRFQQCLDADGVWDYEALPSNREDDWKLTHRFPLEQALELAVKAFDAIVVNGMTLDEFRERRAELAAARADEAND